jgi:beta-glucanase (GH16 family)
VDSLGAGFSQQYGYFEVKAQFPAGLGTWPAFWLLNSDHLTQGASSGEIDVVEAYMQFPTTVNTTLINWGTGTVVGPFQSPVANMSNGFHVYGMLWTASTMTFYFDGAVIRQTATPAVMNQPYYPIIDLGLGGGWSTSQTPQQSDMIVQYVRVYAQ